MFFIRRLRLFLLIAAIGALQAQQAADSGLASADGSDNGFRTSITLFSTLAAINAAGYDAGIHSPLNDRYPLRRQLRTELSQAAIPCLPELKAFYREHKRSTDAADLSQYISFALLAGEPPNFALPEGSLPQEVESVRGFSDLLSRFYKQAKLQDIWNRAQPALNSAIAEYQDPVIASIFEANGYLRNQSGYLGRKFEIYLDVLAEPEQIQVRSYRDDYLVVVTPSRTPPVDEIRDAYLAYLLDPLSYKYSTAIKEKRELQKFAQNAPALDLAYKDDFGLLVTKCLTKAIDARMMHTDAAQKQAYVNEAMREGYILTAAFAELLPVYEKQQDAFGLYYPDLIGAVNVKKEEQRLSSIQFVESVPARVVAPAMEARADPVEAALVTAEGLLDQNDFDTAKKAFRNALEQTADAKLQARAEYGLAVIDLQEKHWDQALDLFESTVKKNPAGPNAAWAHYYMGELALKAGDHDQAAVEFKLAVTTEGASMKARDAAQKALQSSTGEHTQ